MVSTLLEEHAPAQRSATPTNAAEVPGPMPGTAMTAGYVQTVGRMAYLWGWPLVNMANRANSFSKASVPVLLGGIVPVAFGRNAMLTTYVSPDEHFVTCPNQDVVYDDARTDEISQIGQAYGTKPGFYLLVGPDWKGDTPSGITAVVRSSTSLAFVVPRIFMDDTAEDHAAIQSVVSQVVFYPLSEFDGKVKIKDWNKLPHVPAPPSKGETRWVNPETFFDQLPSVMKSIPPLPGEEALYKWISSVLDAAANDPAIRQTLKDTAIAAEHELIPPFFQWRHNGRPVGNGWNSPVNNAKWGTDYLNRTGTAKSNMFDNRPEETKYIYRDNDSKDQQLDGNNLYTITFAKGKTPPVHGFWSLTLYNDQHLFNPNPLGRYSLGTKSKTLKYNTDGSLTIYASAKSPGADKESNWLPAPAGTFSLYIRCYWAERAVLEGTWMPPQVEKVK